MAQQALTISLRDQKRLLKLFQSLKGGAQRRIVRPAITVAQTPAHKTAKRDAPRDIEGRWHNGVFVEGGSLKKSLSKRVRSNSKSGVVMAITGVSRGFSHPAGIQPHRYLHLVNDGTGERWKKSTGQYTGSVKATNFLQRSMTSNENRMSGTFKTKFVAGMQREINKA